MAIVTALILGSAAVASGAVGAGTTAKAVSDNAKAKNINTLANERVEKAKNHLENERVWVADILNDLGNLKVNVLSNSVMKFVDEFSKIKNVDFTNSVGLDELSNFHIDHKDFEELKELGHFAVKLLAGASSGAVGGTLMAFGSYGLAQSLAAASTGTAISALHGAAATNATLAFFGGGSLASGGLGMAGGTMVLGGIVIGPALMVMGLISGAKAQEKVDKALENKAQADEIVEALTVASAQCSAIRRRSFVFYNLLTHLDIYFLPLVWQMEDIIKNEGEDYRNYSAESKKIIMKTVSTAGSIKAVIDTPILNEEGALTIESEEISTKIGNLIYQ